MDQTKVAVVTGASSGVGLAAARGLAKQGYRVVVVGRNQERLAEAVTSVNGVGTGSAVGIRADFARLDDVRQLAEQLLTAYPKIDLLANNAGAIIRTRRTTVDGFEETMQTNHLAPFLLTHLLRDRLTGARVVNTASMAHMMGNLDPEDLSGANKRYSAWITYGTSKLANILFAAEAARQWPQISSFSYHPGTIRSRFGTPVARLFYRAAFFLPTPEQGADTLLWLAETDLSEVVNGGFYDKRRLSRTSRQASNPALAERLWHASAKALNL